MSNIQNISSRLHELRLQLTGLANDFDDRDEIPPSDIDLLHETASAIDELVALSTENECSANNTGIVIQSLTDSIRNRDAIITALRDENARAQSLIMQRDNQIEAWRVECEIHEKDEKELYRLRNEVRHLRTQLAQDFGRGDAYWTAISERDDARRQYCELVHNLEGTSCEKIAHFNGWNDLYSTDNTPNLFEQKSDSDPATGVQYGDLV